MVEKKRAGRKAKIDPVKVARWRHENGASIAETARHFGIGNRTVAKACADQAAARVSWKAEQEDLQKQALQYAERLHEINLALLEDAVERSDRARAEGRWDLSTLFAVMDAANRLIPPDHRDKWWR